MAQLEQIQKDTVPTDWVEQALRVSQQALSTGVTEESVQFAQKTADFARSHNLSDHLIVTLNHLGHLLFLHGKPYEALNVLLEAAGIMDGNTSLSEKMRNSNLLGAVYQVLGNLETAYVQYEKTLQLSRETADIVMEARSLNNLALLLQQQLNHQDALMIMDQAEVLWRQQGNLRELLKTLINTIGIKLDHQHRETGTDTQSELQVHFAEAWGILAQQDDIYQRIALLQYEGIALCKAGQIKEARNSILQALELSETHQIEDLKAHTLVTLGEVLIEEGQPQKALNHLLEAVQLFRDLEYPESILEVLGSVVKTLKQLGRFEEALQHHEELFRLDREIRNEAASKQLELMAFQRKLEQSQHQAELERIRNEELESLVQERTAELESAYLEMLERLAIAAEFRDSDTGEHTVRVGERAAEVARELGMPEERVRILRLAARLHDVGKIAISDTILHKPGKLTEDEYLTMKAHTLAGARMLSEARSELIRMAECIALTHHEKWDGTGYPHGLQGEEIPLEGRIVAVVDVLDALTSQRPYKKAWSMEEALQEIERQSGQHFDPQVVLALLKVHREQG